MIATNYSLSKHWLSLPAPVKKADIFFLYGTSWHKLDKHESNICRIDNATLLAGSLDGFRQDATSFETAGNIFAPYYRQADGVHTLSLPEDKRLEIVGDIPAKDVTAAFVYYIEHFNNGRPFILAGHSQGSNVMLFLLSGYLKEHPEIYKQMIAAYAIGYPVTCDYMAENPHLKYATGPDDTGVVISFNTQSPGVLPGGNPIVTTNKGMVINPITWTRDETVASTSEGLGSNMKDTETLQFNRIPQYADAKVDNSKGVLICSSADEMELYTKYTSHFGPGVFHSFDYPFYYFNIRKNAENRVEKFVLSAAQIDHLR
jgi:hypothetical protein